jgi:2-C-methyl-D-erythritol 4-phosphate cytidylyltransferase
VAGGTWAIVVAAGEGRRFGAPKQFLPLGDHLVVEWSVAAARSVAAEVVLVVPPDAVNDAELHAGCTIVVAGGSSRADSVRRGLAAIPADVERVIVHDAARPLATPALFAAVLDALSDGVDGVIPGVAVRDTIKRVGGGRVTETLVRDELVAVQTPQAFRAAALRDAHADGADATDDAALLESHGYVVAVVAGEESNRKVTSATDLTELERQLTDAFPGGGRG